MFSSGGEEKKENVRQKLEKKRGERTSGSTSPEGMYSFHFSLDVILSVNH